MALLARTIGVGASARTAAACGARWRQRRWPQQRQWQSTGAGESGAAAAASAGAALAGARQLVVVRHGETDWNAQLRVQGTTDIPLNARGRAQAAQSAAALSAELAGARAPAQVYSSGLGRAMTTAQSVADALAASRWTEDNFQAPSDRDCAAGRVVLDDRLAEWNLGCLEGLTKIDAASSHPVDWAAFSDWCNPNCGPAVANKVIEGGESMDAVRLRAVAGMEAAVRTAPDNGRPVIAVTHGGVLGQLLRHAVACQGRKDDAGREYTYAANACVSRFLVVPGGRWEVMEWACVAHLTGDAAPVAAKY